MKVSVPESYYKQLNTILEDKRLPSSIRLFLHSAAKDGRISYQEWVNFSMKYETYSNEQGLGNSEQFKFLKLINRITI